MEIAIYNPSFSDPGTLREGYAKGYAYNLLTEKIIHVPSGKLTKQWNIHIFNRKYILRVDFPASYVSLLECTTYRHSQYFGARPTHRDTGPETAYWGSTID